MAITVDLQLETITCCNTDCGITFAVPSTWKREKRQDHSWFYCPNGHHQHYPGKTDEEKLKEELATLREDRDWWKKQRAREKERREATERSLSATKGVVTRMKNRVAKGVCPCCNRHFEDLQRHMETKHPSYASPEGTPEGTPEGAEEA